MTHRFMCYSQFDDMEPRCLRCIDRFACEGLAYSLKVSERLRELSQAIEKDCANGGKKPCYYDSVENDEGENFM